MPSASDLVVVGGGPGGFRAAIDAASCGLKTTLVEADKLGGTCLNWGCIPTKFLLGASEALPELAAQKKLKIASGEVGIDLPALHKRKNRHIEGVRKAMTQQLSQAGVEFLHGRARIVGPNMMEVRGCDGVVELGFENCVLATGSRPICLPGVEVDGKTLLYSDHIVNLAEVPDSLAIIGGGVIATEIGQIFSRLGAKVAIVESMERILPFEDAEVSAEMARVLKRSGVTIHAASRVESIVADDTGVKLALASGKDILADKALVAIGRRPHAAASHDIELPATPRGGLAVDDHLRVRGNIYAIGDLNDTWQLAHAAEHQGAWVARSIAGKTDSPYRTGPVPVCIYGAPETMRVGPTQEELAEDPTVFASKARLAANPISQAHGATHGFVKILWREERVISVIAVGHGVSRMTVAAQIMVEQGWARRQIEEMMFPHPTLDEALLAAARMEPQQVCPPPADDPECY